MGSSLLAQRKVIEADDNKNGSGFISASHRENIFLTSLYHSCRFISARHREKLEDDSWKYIAGGSSLLAQRKAVYGPVKAYLAGFISARTEKGLRFSWVRDQSSRSLYAIFPKMSLFHLSLTPYIWSKITRMPYLHMAKIVSSSIKMKKPPWISHNGLNWLYCSTLTLRPLPAQTLPFPHRHNRALRLRRLLPHSPHPHQKKPQR